MLYYPKIPGSRDAPSGQCIAFEKYDGTNMHWDWNRDFGWHAFGTRRDVFNLDSRGIELFVHKHAHLHQSVEVFRTQVELAFERIFREHSLYTDYQNIKLFTEFLGPNSFAGLHRESDSKELRVFDVEVDELGLIAPRRFIEDFVGLPIARVVYQGKLTGKFAEDVRTGKYNVKEGVVCKGCKPGERPWMVKIKTYAYQERLKQAFADKWEDYWE